MRTRLWSYILSCTPLLLLGPRAQAQVVSLDTPPRADYGAYAQLDPVIFKSSAKYGPTVTVIDAEELEAKSHSQVLDLLRQEAGLDIVSSGGVGQNTSIFIRGAKSEHTLVLIDGIEVNDSSTPTRLFDFSNMTTESIERIEIYRGAQSVRFGPDALGGVINIITKSNGTQRKGLAHIEAGSLGALNTNLEHLHRIGQFHVLSGLHYSHTDGVSTADAGPHAEADGFRRLSLHQKIKWDLDSDSALQVLIRFSESKTDLDSEGGPQGDDPNYTAQSRLSVMGLQYQRDFMPFIQTRLGLSYTTQDRHYSNLPDSHSPTLYKEDFKSQNYKFEHSTSWQLNTHTKLDGILQWRNESASSHQNFNGTLSDLSKVSQHFWGQALILEHTHNSWTLQAGIRHDYARHTHNESLWSYSLSAEYSVSPSLKINSNWGTAVKTPSLFQLHSAFGNPDLKSEQGWTWDLAFEKIILEDHHFILSFFTQNYTDLIDFNTTTSTYSNISGARISGAELNTIHILTTQLELQLQYKFLDTLDKLQKQSLLRRPTHTAFIQLRYKTPKWYVDLGVRYVDARPDLDPVSWSRISLPSYIVGQALMTFNINEHLKLKARIENMWDEDYNDIAGYNVTPQSFYLGLGAEF